MKKYFATLAMVMLTAASFAQSEKIEPEFIGQVVVVNADSTTTLLQKEATKIKTGSTKFGYIPLPGTSLLDKSKVNMTVKGKESQTKLKSGRLTFIVKAGKNDIDPKSVFGVFQFEVKKKTREFVLAEGSLLGGIQSTTSFNTVPTQVKKYGTESYLVVIENAEPGQYAFTTTDISYVSTFGVE